MISTSIAAAQELERHAKDQKPIDPDAALTFAQAVRADSSKMAELYRVRIERDEWQRTAQNMQEAATKWERHAASRDAVVEVLLAVREELGLVEGETIIGKIRALRAELAATIQNGVSAVQLAEASGSADRCSP